MVCNVLGPLFSHALLFLLNLLTPKSQLMETPTKSSFKYRPTNHIENDSVD